MRNILIVGAPRKGKTSFAKRLAAASGLPIVVNDANAEWGQKPMEAAEILAVMEARHGRPTVFVWEEATGYLSSRRTASEAARVERALTRRHHTKHIHILLFHSLRAVPVWVMDYCDELVLFPTADRPELVRRKFSGWGAIMQAWEEANRPGRRVVAVSPKGDRITEPVIVPIFGA